MGNPFCHVELLSNNSDQAKQFYSQLFDWKLNDMSMPEGTYTLIEVGSQGTGGGIMSNPVPQSPSHWMPYVLVDDVAESAQQAEALGAAILRQKTEVPGAGWLAIIQDPAGAVFGLWQMAQPESG